tara:strand:+ start:28 stop:498 length:471 start_codon:yes stop_codon:yes gene_type:complete
MEIQLLFVGKTKKKYLLDELEAYKKKILRFIKFSFVCVEETKTKKTNIKQLKEKEYQLVLKKLTPNDIVILLDEKGKMLNSVDFACEIKSYINTGKKRILFIIGGAYGLSKKFYDDFPIRIAFSRMTFSHQMIRLFFCEQLYRAFTIINNHPYHNN